MSQNPLIPQNVELPDFLATQQTEQRILSAERREVVMNTAIGLGFVAAVGAAAFGIVSAHNSDVRIGHEMPFSPPLQEALNNVDNVLEVAGEAGLVLALGTIGGVKIFATHSPQLRSIERGSSKELTNDGHSSDPSFGRRALRRTFAGSVPIIAGIAVGAATFMANVGDEISAGPDRAINAFNDLTPGDTMIVQDGGAMPMVESNVSAKLATAIEREAARHHISIVPLDLNLGTIEYGTQATDTLVAGVLARPGSPLSLWDPSKGCNDMPVLLDSSAHMPVDSNVTVNGIRAKVVGELFNASAIDRIAVGMTNEELKACAKQDPEAGDHALIVDTDTATAQQVLQTAEQGINAPATVITKEQYEVNSETFWDANAKPLTNLFDVLSLLTDVVAIGGAAGGRLLRNRQQWSQRLAAGMSANHLRATEMLHAAKDGVAATGLGLVLGTVLTPVANAAVVGFDAGTGFKDAMVGAAVGTLGAALGTMSRLIGLRKSMNPKEFAK